MRFFLRYAPPFLMRLLAWNNVHAAGEEGEGIDVSQLEEMRAVMGEQYASIVRMFLNNTEKLIGHLESGKDRGEFIREVHSLKSSSRYMGALRLGDIAERIEKAAQEDAKDEQGGRRLLRDLQTEWRSCRVFFEEELRKSQG